MCKNCARAALAASLWVAALGLAIVATFEDHQVILATWSVLVAMVASVLTGWVLLVHERARTEEIAHVAAVAAVEHVRRLESVK